MTSVHQVISAYRNLGLRKFVGHAIVRLLGPSLARLVPFVGQGGITRYAGMKVRINSQLALTPSGVVARPNYEYGLIQGLKSVVRPGDNVVVVGGGLGVTVSLAAKLVGSLGSVTCFEGGAAEAAEVRSTAALNGVARRVLVHHAIVGSGEHVYSSKDGAALLDAKDLPPCDVLELDCEGAERDILSGLGDCPRAIVVECHGVNGASSRDVTAMLANLGYKVASLGVAEPDEREFCERHDIMVLLGTRSDLP